MKCLKCNAENKEIDKICKKCGQQLIKTVVNEETKFSYNFIPALFAIALFIIFAVLKLLIFK